MVQKKRKSKRQTPKTRHKIHRKLKQEIIKQKKKEARAEKLKIKVPVEILRTDEEIEQLKQIQTNEKIRKNIITPNDLIQTPVYKQLVESSNIVIQLIDARDVESIWDLTSKATLNVITKIDLVPDFIKTDIMKNNDFVIWEGCCEEIIKRIRKLVSSNKIMVSVVGQCNVGKSTFIQCFRDNAIKCEVDGMSVLQISDDISIIDRIGHLDVSELSLSNVLRNAIEYSHVDVEYFVGEVLSRIDSTELSIFYGIGIWKSTKEFLKMLGKKIDMDRCKLVEIGKRFLFDLSSGKIQFYRINTRGQSDFLINIPN